MLFATHFKEIAMAFEGRSGFANLHLHTEESISCEGVDSRLKVTV